MSGLGAQRVLWGLAGCARAAAYSLLKALGDPGSVLAAVLWAIRGLAPTRPVMTGATAGRLAGGVGALVYTLHCPELEAPFLGVWYVIGMAIPTAIGAFLGPRLLRW